MPRKIKSVQATSDLLLQFRKDCAAYFSNLRSREPRMLPLPTAEKFQPQFRHFAETILGEEKLKHERVVKDVEAMNALRR